MASGTDRSTFEGLTRDRLNEILAGIGNVRVALVGDLCLDAYWKADMTKSELSRETPHFPLPIVEERYAPGAGGNATANLAALAPVCVTAIGVAGCDWRGDVLLKELEDRGVEATHVVRSPARVTNAYIKPCRQGISELVYEDPRLDFADHGPQSEELDTLVSDELERVAPTIDVLCVSDQFQFGCVTPAVRERIVALAQDGLPVVVDSRYRIGLFAGCILKPNELEGSRAVGMDSPRGMEEFSAAAIELARRAGSPVCMTVGARGCLVAQGRTLTHVPAAPIPPPLDICGAGDTFLAAFACALAAGANLCEAAAVANLASGVTVKKLGQTGTASRAEILRKYDEGVCLREIG